jgi:hypothetical protein
MSALYESWIRPLVIILTVPLAMFGALVGLWAFDLPLDVFGQIGLVMLIGLETKNAILIIEFAVELRETQGMSIIDSAKEASRLRLRPILMTSFAFIMGVLPMARATGAGAYSRNSLGIVIAFGMVVSTVLGRFVIPIYYVLGERLRGTRLRPHEPPPAGLGGGLEDVRAGDVRRHEVRRELDPLERQVHDSGDGADEQRLRQPRHADQEAVAPAEQGHDHLFDHLMLPHDDLADLVGHPFVGGSDLLHRLDFRGRHRVGFREGSRFGRVF